MAFRCTEQKKQRKMRSRPEGKGSAWWGGTMFKPRENPRACAFSCARLCAARDPYGKGKRSTVLGEQYASSVRPNQRCRARVAMHGGGSAEWQHVFTHIVQRRRDGGETVSNRTMEQSAESAAQHAAEAQRRPEEIQGNAQPAAICH